jgi:hypothetical protein
MLSSASTTSATTHAAAFRLTKEHCSDMNNFVGFLLKDLETETRIVSTSCDAGLGLGQFAES